MQRHSDGRVLNYRITAPAIDIFNMPRRIERKIVSNRQLLALLKRVAKRFRCKKCGYKCSAAETLSRHKRNRHPRFICGNCGQKYLQGKRFQDHINSETGCADFVQSNGILDRHSNPPSTINTQQLGMFLTKINFLFTLHVYRTGRQYDSILFKLLNSLFGKTINATTPALYRYYGAK